MLATTAFLDQSRRDDLEREEALVPHPQKPKRINKKSVVVSIDNPEEFQTVDGVERMVVCKCLIEKYLCDVGQQLIHNLFFEELSLDECSKIMSISISNVKKMRNRCLTAMREGKKISFIYT